MILRTTICISTVALFLFVQASAQSHDQRSAKNNFHGVTLSFLSQRCLPRDPVPYVGDDVIDFSDLVTRFRLENRGPKEIYYLADNVLNGIESVGFQLSRRSSGVAWDAIYSPARKREGIFTGIAYSWLSLSPGSALEFERSDVSFKESEHATSVFLNLTPEDKGRVELVSTAFVVKRCRKLNNRSMKRPQHNLGVQRSAREPVFVVIRVLRRAPADASR